MNQCFNRSCRFKTIMCCTFSDISYNANDKYRAINFKPNPGLNVWEFDTRGSFQMSRALPRASSRDQITWAQNIFILNRPRLALDIKPQVLALPTRLRDSTFLCARSLCGRSWMEWLDKEYFIQGTVYFQS